MRWSVNHNFHQYPNFTCFFLVYLPEILLQLRNLIHQIGLDQNQMNRDYLRNASIHAHIECGNLIQDKINKKPVNHFCFFFFLQNYRYHWPTTAPVRLRQCIKFCHENHVHRWILFELKWVLFKRQLSTDLYMYLFFRVAVRFCGHFRIEENAFCIK